MDRVVAIVGPTAVGKTKVSIDIAKRLGTSIISGDSMLVYRGLDIGTAKPSLDEQDGIEHYLIDIREPDQDFSVADFQHLADKYISTINAQGKIALIAGGTGLYIKALLEGYDLSAPPRDEQIREKLQQAAQRHGNEYLHNMLAVLDSAKAATLHPNDVRRVIRALEIRMLTDKPRLETTENKQYDSLVIGLTMQRERLYERINQRVDNMLQAGLVEEVRLLLDKGIPVNCQSMQAIGYKQMVDYFTGNKSLDETVVEIKQASRQFAKRQMTWYRKMPYISWTHVDQFASHDELVEHIYNLVAEKFSIE